MIKRLTVLAFILTSLLLTSCDRKTSSQIILSIGLNTNSESPLGSLLETDTGDFAEGEFADFDFAPQIASPSSTREVAAALEELHELLSRSDRSERVLARADQLIDEVQQMSQAADRSDRRTTTVLGEAELAALTVGAELRPDEYLQRRNAFHAKLVSGNRDGGSLERRSIRRIIEALANDELPTEVHDLLKLHALTYPRCQTNIDLYLAAIKQFVDTQQIELAITTAREGLQSCTGDPQRRLLQTRMQEICQQNPCAKGVPMNFVGPDLNGGRFELKSLRGEPVLVVFWATWCPSCRKESAVIKKIVERYRSQGIRVVGVSLDDSRSALDDFVKKNRLDWPQVHTSQSSQTAWKNPIAKYYRIDSIPNTFLLDENGDVVASGLRGERAINTALSDLLSS